ncbi:hypothetical protein FE257_000777 [Aspergillus nanangensis]|uniref:Cytochrome P450 n=1 Tax=Aspergillus nanangensis TaxID=2582783 RepID=A0AAD4CEJ8_ASPNN|nr:hypothetical protein FE257_000777 [Aspergillus nanangensis]
MAGLATWVGVIALSYLATKYLYRLYFHPLSKFPGPRLAAASSLYEFYFNVVRRGMFVWEIERLHQVYGPIIRINPREVHIKDPEYYDEIYASSARKREKDPVNIARFDLDGSAFAAVSPEQHRLRRAPLDRFFSKQAITNLEPLIWEKLDALCDHFTRAFQSHKVINLDAGFAGLTSDIIYRFVFGVEAGNLDRADFNESVRDGINGLFRMGHITFFFPFIQSLMSALPLAWLEKVNPYALALMNQKKAIQQHTTDMLDGNMAKSERESIIGTIAGPNGPDHMKHPMDLTNDGWSLIIGGTETTARSLSLGAFHLFTNATMRKKLREELRSVMPTADARPTWNQLEQLPYLSGFVCEALRLSTGIASRSARVAPTEALVYKDYVIPPKTLVSQTNYFTLMDPTIFPDPHAFDPERWMRAAAQGDRLDRYLVNFSKGTRMCVGKNLAWAELYLVFATLARRFDMELHQTTADNIAFVRDFGMPYPDEGNLSVQALVTKILTD